MSRRRQLENNNDSSILRIKIISMGDGGVGKSCVIKRYCEEKFVSKYISTIGIDYGVKPVMVDGKEVRVNFWDLSGHPEFFERSFAALDDWLQEARQFSGGSKFPCIVCGNKVDKQRSVKENDARAWAASKGFEYFETSAKTGANIDTALNTLFKKVVEEASS